MLDTEVKVFHESISFHEMTLKLYFMKCPERKISQCILPFRNIERGQCLSHFPALINKDHGEISRFKFYYKKDKLG